MAAVTVGPLTSGQRRTVGDTEEIALHRFAAPLRVYRSDQPPNNEQRLDTDICENNEQKGSSTRRGGWKDDRSGVSHFVPFDRNNVDGAWRYAHERVASFIIGTPFCFVTSPQRSAMPNTALRYDTEITHPQHGPVAFHITRHPTNPVPINQLEQYALCQFPANAWIPCRIEGASEEAPRLPDLDDDCNPEVRATLSLLAMIVCDDKIAPHLRFGAALYEYIVASSSSFQSENMPLEMFSHDNCQISQLLLLAADRKLDKTGKHALIYDTVIWECKQALKVRAW